MRKFYYLLIALILISTLFGCTGSVAIDTKSVTITTDIQPAHSGTITVSPSFAKYQKDSIVNLTASPASNMVFDHWSGDASDTASSIYLTLDSNKKVTANFKRLFTLSITVNPLGSGSVSAKSRLYKEGETVIVTAIPTSGFGFANWSGDNTSSITTINIVMNSEKTLQANFIDASPAEISNLTAKPSKQSIILTWVEPRDVDLKGVEISSTDLSSPLFVNKGTNRTEVTGLAENRLYTFTIKTVDITGNKSAGVNIGATPYELAGVDYFKISNGWGVNYRVTDNYSSMNLDGHTWVISQYNKKRLDRNFDFLFTLTQDGGTGYYANSCLGGYLTRTDRNSTLNLIAFELGNPASNQGQWFYHFALPQVFNAGNSWTWLNNQFTVEKSEPRTISGVTFSDCIKVSVNFTDTNPFMQGSGYYILSRDVGIVEIVFNRANGTKMTYEYVKSQLFDESAATVILNSIVIH